MTVIIVVDYKQSAGKISVILISLFFIFELKWLIHILRDKNDLKSSLLS